MVEYRYELRRGEEVLATGHLTRERPLEVGERIVIGGRPGIGRDAGGISGWEHRREPGDRRPRNAAAREAGLDASPADDLDDAIMQVAAWSHARADDGPPRILVCGSLYFAGKVLEENS